MPCSHYRAGEEICRAVLSIMARSPLFLRVQHRLGPCSECKEGTVPLTRPRRAPNSLAEIELARAVQTLVEAIGSAKAAVRFHVCVKAMHPEPPAHEGRIAIHWNRGAFGNTLEK
jgi:hypothetical protein